MHTLRHLPLALGVMVILAGPALAQRGGGPGQGGRGGQFGGQFGGQMGMMGGGLAQILGMPPVAEELKLSGAQASEVRTIVEQIRGEMMSRMQESRGQFADLTPEERRERFDQMAREMDATARDRLKEVLRPEQLTRLEQIQIQQQGVQAFANPRVREELKLTDEQRTKLDELLADHRAETQALMANARQADDRAQVMREMMELRTNALSAAMAVLTDEQESTWKQLTGEPFRMGPGGFGPGGRQGGRGGPGGGRPSN